LPWDARTLCNTYIMAGKPQGDDGGFEITRAVINIGGLVIAAGMIVLIIAAILAG
jgi:hypothetical protein